MADEKLFYHPETGEVLNGIKQSILSLDGRLEYPDPVPVAAGVQLRAPASGMRQLVQEMIRQEMSELAELHEMETFEEADDFDIEDDPVDPLTPYEKVFDPKDADKAPTAAKPSAEPNGGPNVKRSEGDEQRAVAATAADPGSNGADNSKRASSDAAGGSKAAG